NGVCAGTVPADSGTPCFFPGLEKCFAAGQCVSVPIANISFCMPGAPKACQPAGDPCQQAFCNPQTRDRGIGEKCLTFFGCETCNAGTCVPTNLGGPCTNPEGDFNPCTTDDRCVSFGGSAFSTLESMRTELEMTGAGVPPAVAAALFDPQQVAQRG